MSIYDRNSKASKIIEVALENKINIFAPISVKNELINVLKREFNWRDDKTDFIVESLPVKWIEKEIYELVLEKTTVKHKPDKPVEAVAIILDCGILSADSDFKGNKRIIDIDELLEKIY